MNTVALLQGEGAKFAAQGLKAVSHPARLKILCSLLAAELTVTEITRLTGLSQSGASQHLAKMVAAGMLTSRRSGTQIFYSAPDLRYQKLIEALCSIYGGRTDGPLV